MCTLATPIEHNLNIMTPNISSMACPVWMDVCMGTRKYQEKGDKDSLELATLAPRSSF
jgi:hypothetical protein